MDSDVKELHLRNPSDYKKWRTFLESLDITNFSDSEVAKIDITLGIFYDDELVATGSLAGSTLKYIAVCNKHVVTGSRFNVIVSALVNRQFQRGIFHMFVFTKKKYSESFQHVGFSELASTDEAAVLENGRPNIDDFLAEVKAPSSTEAPSIGAIVMNANPFTNGHLALVKKASRECDFLYVFVVQTDVSLFDFEERLDLVKKGTEEFSNVKVVSGGDYMVSYLTFPAYFLKSPEQAIKYQTTIDARIFRDKVAPALGIRKRFVGTEPFSKTTGLYNETLAQELPPAVELEVVPRVMEGQSPVTATEVRRLVKDHNVVAIKQLVPKTTYSFIEKNMKVLESRIEEGMNIDGN